MCDQRALLTPRRTHSRYIAWETSSGEVFVTTRRAARNMSYQGITHVEGEVKVLAEVLGADLLGAALKAPMTSYNVIYALPMMTIKGKLLP